MSCGLILYNNNKQILLYKNNDKFNVINGNDLNDCIRNLTKKTYGLINYNDINLKTLNFTNQKYNYTLYFINYDFDNNLINNINKINSYFDNNQNIEFNTNQYFKYFSINQIIQEYTSIDNKLLNTLLKSIKNNIINLN